MPIRIKVDVTKLLKEHFFKGQKGTYVDLVLWETPDDQYDNDFRCVQDLGKEARDRGEKGPIVGNGKNFGNFTGREKAKKQEARKEPPPTRKPAPDPDLDAADDDIPF